MNVIEDFCDCGGVPKSEGVLDTLQKNILDCSWIKQPQFAFSASLVLMAGLISRKVTFQGMSPNLYVLNIAPSGSGKDAPQKKLQEVLVDINAENLLGAGDYVSDASLMDGLANKPVRIDVLDEAGGILRSVNNGKSEYNSKMADVLAELYTSSNSKYLGRATAEGTKGACYRPNVSILASTTPTGFQEGVSLRAIEKGLLGRFLIFYGDSEGGATRLKRLPHLDTETLNRLRFWRAYEPKENRDYIINGIPQMVEELEATPEANTRLDEIFKEFDDLRRSTKHSNPVLPIIARLYQQMVKIAMIHCCSRAAYKVEPINVTDIEFGYLTIKQYYETIQHVIENYIFNNSNEKNKLRILNVIKEGKVVDRRTLYNATRELNKRERDSILDELVELEFIDRLSMNVKGKNKIVFKYINEEVENEEPEEESNTQLRDDNTDKGKG